MLSLTPSFMTLAITGMILMFVVILMIINYKQIAKIAPIELASFLCVLSIAIGSHGLLHLGLEVVYGYNPLKWF
jgi:hypothetical protein